MDSALTQPSQRAQNIAQRGQSLAEYGLICCLVAVAGVAGVVALGGNIESTLQGMGFGANPAPAVAAASTGSPTPAASPTPAMAASLPTDTPVPGGQGSTISITLSNGQSFQLSNYPTDIPHSIQTVGANGTTTMLLGNLDQVIQQLVAKGDLTPAQTDLLSQLSNQGHRIGSIEALTEPAIIAGNGSQNITQVDGYPADALWAASTVGWTNGAYGEESGKFNDLYNQVASSGALSDPNAQQVVSTLVNQILNVANGFETSTANIRDGSVQPTQFDQEIATGGGLIEIDWFTGSDTMEKSLTDLGPAVVTHQDSAKICTTGGGADSGTNCTP